MPETKKVMNYADIMNRYEVSEAVARKLIREIRAYCGGGCLSNGKVLDIEVEAWERRKLCGNRIGAYSER